MKKKIYCFIIALALGLSGCGSVVTETESTHTENETKSVEVFDKEIEVPTEIKESSVGEVTEWSLAYANYIESLEATPGFTYMLIYLDEDNIPELFISTECEAGGEIVATYYNGEVIDYQLSRIGTKYIEYNGLMHTNTGHMDYYPVYIMRLENGVFSEIAEGISYLSDEDREALSDYGDYVLTYEWEGTVVSEEEFDAHVAEYFDLDKSLYPDPAYTEAEMLSILTTGVWTSYGHSYELFQQDVTWEEAAEICKEQGGYLATITSPDEAEVIAELISSKSMGNISFYVGYRSSEWIGDEFYGSRWINTDDSFTDVTYLEGLSEYNAPDYDYSYSGWSVENGEKDCGLVKYYDSVIQIHVFDAPSKVYFRKDIFSFFNIWRQPRGFLIFTI